MKSIISKLSRFIREEEGLELSEYAVAGSLIVLGTVLAFTSLGEAIATAIGQIITAVSSGGAGV